MNPDYPNKDMSDTEYRDIITSGKLNSISRPFSDSKEFWDLFLDMELATVGKKTGRCTVDDKWRSSVIVQNPNEIYQDEKYKGSIKI